MTSIESTVNPANLAFVEELYEKFLRDASSVSAEWREYFSHVADGELGFPQPRFGPSFKPSSLFNPSGRAINGTSTAPGSAGVSPAAGVPSGIQDRIYMLIRLYRVRGHRIARIDPLGRIPPTPKELEPEFFGFTPADMDLPIHSETFQYDGPLTLGQLLQRLRNTYCRSIGVQYMHIDDLSVRRWLQRRMETTENRIQLTRDEQLRILTRLTDAVTFEEFIRKKFVGAKTFSLEGSESLIPLLDLALEKAGEQGVGEVVMAMAHRGRLNVLANIIGKSPRQIFREFADTGWKSSPGRGDVKYHLGHSSEWTTATGKKIQLALCFNPSHLELVNGVAPRSRTRAPGLLGGHGPFAIARAVDSRRCFVRRRGSGPGNSESQPARRVCSRRDAARGCEQSNWLYHGSFGSALNAIRDRRGEDVAESDFSRERRRPGGRGASGPAGDGFSA